VDSIGSYGNDEQYEIDELVEDWNGKENEEAVEEDPYYSDLNGRYSSSAVLRILLDLVTSNKYDNFIESKLLSGFGNGNYQVVDHSSWSEKKVIGLDFVKNQLQDYIKFLCLAVDVGALSEHPCPWETIPNQSMKCCEFNLSGKIGQQLLDMPVETEDDEPIVQHDQSLDPYWNDLSDTFLNIEERAVRKYRIKGINIAKVELRKEVLDMIADKIGGDLRSVQLNDTNLSPEALVSVSTLLESNQHLHTLQLYRNQLVDQHASMHLSRSLKAHKGIEHLDLSNCNLGDNAEVLQTILQSNVKSMDLSKNRIGSFGAAKIAEYLEDNTDITRLILDRNSLRDTDAILFVQALKKNTTLRRLYLRRNNFTAAGAKTLIRGFFDPSSLNAMSDCNHICALHMLSTPVGTISSLRYRGDGRRRGGGRPLEGEDFISLLNWESNRTNKLLSLFNAKESMMHYLEDVPVECMPEVLSFIQNEKDQKKLTNSMYAIVRYWEMPTLYSFSGSLPQLRSNGSAGKRKRDCFE